MNKAAWHLATFIKDKDCRYARRRRSFKTDNFDKNAKAKKLFFISSTNNIIG